MRLHETETTLEVEDVKLEGGTAASSSKRKVIEKIDGNDAADHIGSHETATSTKKKKL
ncbi:6927_t:CDS:2 [Entrophospora sp. SA101]|nr:2000_t:CDS:2 [Entrophospora sp. SA101]CAJ0757224.1 5402_t:CDS:2 [Entrophospora sp. SA101]CAJ0766132.1 6927_t:CDS:2 [Entrophospora sp. SA101]